MNVVFYKIPLNPPFSKGEVPTVRASVNGNIFYKDVCPGIRGKLCWEGFLSNTFKNEAFWGLSVSQPQAQLQSHQSPAHRNASQFPLAPVHAYE